jgi:hypothetical protein
MKVERQSAQASNRMTRRNGPRGHLLSTFNKQKEEEIERAPEVTQPVIEADNHFDVDLSPMSSSSLSSPIDVEDPSDVDVSLEPVLPRVPSRPEPGIHDEPLSTEDESSDAESLPARREINYITLEQKLAGNDPSQGSSQSQRKSFLSHPRSDSDDDMTFSGRSSQYQNKRSKTTKVVYTSKAPKSNVFNYPPYPKQSSSPQAKPKPQAKSTPKVKKKTVEEQVEIEKSQPSFKVPMEIEESQSSFKVPMEIGDSSSNVKTKKGNSTFENEENDTLQYYSDGDGGSPLSSISSTTFKNMEDKVDTPPPTKSLCPMCKTEVDPEVLALFQSQKKQRIREQQQFCQSHQLRTAAQQWDKLGYPTILWEDFESRMQDHFSDLEKLLVPDVSSYYRNMLDDVLKAGKAKNFRLTMDCKSLEAITCGYYGAKGANKMYVPRVCPCVR